MPEAPWFTAVVRISEFQTLVEDEFGASYASTLVRDHVLSALGDRTAGEALVALAERQAALVALAVETHPLVERLDQ